MLRKFLRWLGPRVRVGRRSPENLAKITRRAQVYADIERRKIDTWRHGRRP